MAMIIAWQTINAVRRPGSRRFTRGFLVVTPGVTIRDRLRLLQPNDPDSYYASRELVPKDMLRDLERAKIVITNYHAFLRRETLELSKGGAPCSGVRDRTCGRRRPKGRCCSASCPPDGHEALRHLAAGDVVGHRHARQLADVVAPYPFSRKKPETKS